MRSHFTCLTLLTMFLAPIGCSRSGINEDRVVNVAEDDAEMNAAMETARAKLPEFWEKFENPGETEEGFGLKVKVTDEHGTEFFWATDLEKKEGRVYGTIDNDPQIVKSVRNGERIEIPDDKVADWMYMRDGKMVGNYTLRVILTRQSEETAAPYRELLADP